MSDQLYDEWDAACNKVRELKAELAELREAAQAVISGLSPPEIVYLGFRSKRYCATYRATIENPVMRLAALLPEEGK